VPNAELTAIQRTQDEHGHKIESLERTIEKSFPPMLEEVGKVAKSVHEMSVAVMVMVERADNQVKAAETQASITKEGFTLMAKRFETAEARRESDKKEFLDLKEEVVQSRDIIKSLKGISTKIIWLVISTIVCSGSLIAFMK